jgi:hypothetical protein
MNECRESGDHGVLNEWNRLPYLFNPDPDGGSGTAPTTAKLYDAVRNSLFIANYQNMAALDTDDVSGRLIADSNFFAYSPFALKSDFGGYGLRATNNVYAYLAETSW